MSAGPDEGALASAVPTVGPFTWSRCPRCRRGETVYRCRVSILTGSGVVEIGRLGACALCGWTPYPPPGPPGGPPGGVRRGE